MTNTLTDGCYCYGELITQTLNVRDKVKVADVVAQDVTTERINADVINSDYAYTTTETGSETINAAINLTLANETIHHWSDIAEYTPSIESSKFPVFDKVADLCVDLAVDDSGKYWLKLVQNGTNTDYYVSSDGVNWTNKGAVGNVPGQAVETIPGVANAFVVYGAGEITRIEDFDNKTTTTIADLNDKLCLKTIGIYTGSTRSTAAWYEDVGLVMFGMFGAYVVSNTSGYIAGFHRMNRIWNIKPDGSLLILLRETPSYVQSTNSTLYDLNKTWLDIAYIRETDTIAAINTDNQIVISRNGMVSIDKTITNDSALKAHPFYGAFVFSTLNGSNNWQYMTDEMTYNVNPTFQPVNNPSALLRYHFNECTQRVTVALEDGTYVMHPTRPSQELINSFLNVLYPIGSIYQSMLPTSPSLLFGGKWRQLTNYLKPTTDPESIGQDVGSNSHTHTLSGQHAVANITLNPTYREIWNEIGEVSYSSHQLIYGIDGTGDPSHTPTTVNGTALSGSTESASNIPASTQLFVWLRYA